MNSIHYYTERNNGRPKNGNPYCVQYVRTYGDFSWGEFDPKVSERLVLIAKK